MNTEPHTAPGEILHTVQEISRHWRISERQVRQLIYDGDLVSTRIGRRVLIAESDALEFLRQHRGGGEA